MSDNERDQEAGPTLVKGSWQWVRGPRWWHGIPVAVRVAGALVIVFTAGMTTWAVASSQFAVPAILSATVTRVDGLEDWRDDINRVLPGFERDHDVLNATVAALDSLKTLANDTYCIVRAQALGLDPFRACTLAQTRPQGGGGGAGGSGSGN